MTIRQAFHLQMKFEERKMIMLSFFARNLKEELDKIVYLDFENIYKLVVHVIGIKLLMSHQDMSREDSSFFKKKKQRLKGNDFIIISQ